MNKLRKDFPGLHQLDKHQCEELRPCGSLKTQGRSSGFRPSGYWIWQYSAHCPSVSLWKHNETLSNQVTPYCSFLGVGFVGPQAPCRGTEVYQNVHKQINSRLEILILGQAGIPQQSCGPAELPEAMCQGMGSPPSGCPAPSLAASQFPEFWNDSPGWEWTPGQWTEANQTEEERVVEGPMGRWTHTLGPHGRTENRNVNRPGVAWILFLPVVELRNEISIPLNFPSQALPRPPRGPFLLTDWWAAQPQQIDWFSRGPCECRGRLPPRPCQNFWNTAADIRGVLPDCEQIMDFAF